MQSLNRNALWAGALMDELAHCGVRHVCISPGSRSAPLALSAATHPELEDRSILDERSAAFFALGLARASRTPVALVCTSGTAAANYLPAVVEAHYSRVPLILLTADRPIEERDCGAGQTIDQAKLYEPYVRSVQQLPEPALEPALLRHVRRVACRAVAAALGGPPGPVHVNVPFREPLAPVVVPEDERAVAELDALSREGRGSRPMTRVAPAEPMLTTPAELERIARSLAAEPHGWIVAGPLDASAQLSQELTRLAHAIRWPLLADPLSGLRSGPHDRALLVDAHDAVLHSSAFVEAHLPRVVLRFGDMPTSKAYRTLLGAHPEITQLVVDPWGWSDPTALANELVRADPGRLANALAQKLELMQPRPASEFAEHWVRAGLTARRLLDSALEAQAGVSEPAAVRTLSQLLPDAATLFVASSMPIRDVDLIWPSSARSLRILANRGANGIDGTVSCALGSALGCGTPLVLLVGDLALLHDWTGLLLTRDRDIHATIVVLDNSGGGIFEFLPISSSAPREIFERHFATGQDVDLCAALEGFGLASNAVRSSGELRDAIESSLGSPGVQLIVLRTDRRENLELHRKLGEAVAHVLEPAGRS